jgi:hypothetical protein
MRARLLGRGERVAIAAGGLLLALALGFGLVRASQARPRAAGELDGYDFRDGRGTQHRLPAPLREISGLAVAPDGRVFAHGDEQGIVYELDAARGTVVGAFSLGRVPPRDDFEGIAFAGARLFLVTSTGRLYETRVGADGAAVPFTVVDTRVGAACEIEGLAYDPTDAALLIPCKRPYDAALRGSVTLFRWSVARGALAAPPRISVPLADVVRGTKLTEFHPSSVERAPRTGHYVIVAGPQHALVEVTPAGAVVATRTLPARVHRQPEGITFLGDSAALIADEGGSKRGTLTVYRRAP